MMDPKLGKPLTLAKPKAAMPPVVRPYHQGSLDSYCGFYAIINAMLRLKPEAFAKDGAADKLFYTMFKAATRICSPQELCSEGMDGIELEYVAKAAVRHMAREGHRFGLKRPRATHLNDSATVANLLVQVNSVATIAVILHVEDRNQSHWSVLAEVRGQRVRLFDSDAMHSTALKKCEPVLIVHLTRPATSVS